MEKNICQYNTKILSTRSNEKQKILKGESFSEKMIFAINCCETLIITDCIFLEKMEITCCGSASLQLNNNTFHDDVLIKKNDSLVDSKINHFEKVTVSDCSFLGAFECCDTICLQLDGSAFHHNVLVKKGDSYEDCKSDEFETVLIVECKFFKDFECCGTKDFQSELSCFYSGVYINKSEPKMVLNDCTFFGKVDIPAFRNWRSSNKLEVESTTFVQYYKMESKKFAKLMCILLDFFDGLNESGFCLLVTYCMFLFSFMFLFLILRFLG